MPAWVSPAPAQSDDGLLSLALTSSCAGLPGHTQCRGYLLSSTCRGGPRLVVQPDDLPALRLSQGGLGCAELPSSAGEPVCAQAGVLQVHRGQLLTM